MINNEKLILLVQNSPELWDKNVKGYHDKNVRELCWDLIGTEMCDNWSRMPENIRDMEKKKLRNRWRHIRDNFFKYIKGEIQKEPGRKRTKYLYAESLIFLQPAFEKKIVDIGLDSVTDDDTSGFNAQEQNDNFEAAYARPEMNMSNDGNRNEFQNEIYQTMPETSFETNAQISKLSTFENNLLELLNKNNLEGEDADRAFLISLLPDYKNLNDDQKLDFRMGVLKLLRSIKRNESISLY